MRLCLITFPHVAGLRYYKCPIYNLITVVLINATLLEELCIFYYLYQEYDKTILKVIYFIKYLYAQFLTTVVFLK